MRVEEEPPQAERTRPHIEALVAVLRIARERMSCVRRVHADLVCAARERLHLYERRAVIALDRMEARGCRLALLLHAHDALRAAAVMRVERGVDDRSVRPVASDEGEVTLLHPALAQQRVQGAERAAFLRN